MQGPIHNLRAAIGRTAYTERLFDGRIASPRLQLAFETFPVISRAFAPMVREGRFDISEMAIATFLQARACEKPLVLLPVVLAGRFQEPALLCRAESDIRSPADLAGRRVGVRAYSQTTGLWLRGVIADAYGVAPADMNWVTFEDAHVQEVGDPPFVERAPAGKELLGMLRDGEIDAAIVGNDMPDDASLRPVIADPAAAAEAFWQRHGVVPINHMVVVTRALADESPEIVTELVRLFQAMKRAHPNPARDPRPIGREGVAKGVALALHYATAQHMLPRPLTEAELWDGLPGGAAGTDRARPLTNA